MGTDEPGRAINVSKVGFALRNRLITSVTLPFPPAWVRIMRVSVGGSAGLPASGQLGASPGKDVLRGCPVRELKERLSRSGIRPTRQRIALGWLLFGKGPRHITAEGLYEEANAAKVFVSLATVYNTLRQFTKAGLLREIPVEGAKTQFDTKVSTHHHFMFEEEHALRDIAPDLVEFSKLPPAPEGMEIARIDVVVRLRRIKAR